MKIDGFKVDGIAKPSQMYFGLPKNDGLAHFAQVDPSKLKYLYKYAGDMELTFGEYMFDFMLDVENDNEKIDQLLASGYNPKLDDGVGKNIAPLQKAGLISYEVLKSTQLKKYLEADW